MSAPQLAPKLTPEEYLQIERAAPFRSEYYAGEMFAMSGGSPRHSLITLNVGSELRARLKGRSCTPYDSNLRIRVSATGLYTYPDVSVFCEKMEVADHRGDTALNLTLVVEVLSDSTEAYDRGKKFDHYRKIPSLRDYLLVCQDRPQCELFSRTAAGSWALTVVNGLDQSLEIASIGVALPLADVYEKVDFSTEETAPLDARRDPL